jgi:hypothetical protein
MTAACPQQTFDTHLLLLSEPILAELSTILEQPNAQPNSCIILLPLTYLIFTL